jgi:hypothetical protein
MKPLYCRLPGGSWRSLLHRRAAAWLGRLLVANLIVLLCLSGLGFVYREAIAQNVMGQYLWRMATDPTVLTVEQEKAKVAICQERLGRGRLWLAPAGIWGMPVKTISSDEI